MTPTNVVAFPAGGSLTAETFQALTETCDVLRLDISQASTVEEAYRLWRQLAHIALEVTKLVDLASDRLKELQR